MAELFSFIESETLYTLGIVALSLIVAIFIFPIIKKIIHKLTKATKTTLDDEIAASLEKPVYIGILILGAYYAINTVNFLEKYATYIKIFFILIAILWGVVVARKLVNTAIKWYGIKSRKAEDETFLPIIRRIVNIFIYVIGIILALHFMGIEITPLVAGLGIGGLAIALALQDTLSNLFAGTYIASDKTIKVGDYIELENGVSGYIEQIGWRSSRIRTTIDQQTNNYVIIPNSKLAQGFITNLDYPDSKTILPISVGISYDSDLEKVEEVAMEVAKHILKNTEGAAKDFRPIFRYMEFAESNINFRILLQTEHARFRSAVTHEFIKALYKKFRENGIEISYPSRNIYMRGK